MKIKGDDKGRPATLKFVLAFASVYLIWGSTYLAIRYAIETLPPFLMAGTRFLMAGGALYAWARFQGAERPARINWKPAFIVGGLLLLGGNGMVVLAEQRVASGLAALLIATEPLWIVLLDWARPDGPRPSGRVTMGLACGFLGMVLLVGPGHLTGIGRIDLVGAAMLIVGSLSWAVGSLYAIGVRMSRSPLMSAAMQMLAGGALLLIAGTVMGEWSRFSVANVSLASLVAYLYLIFFGSLVGFTSYSWLLKVTTPARASTYAYVNPVVAVLLGWAFAGEALTLMTVLAAGVIVAGVVIITTYRGHESREAEPVDSPVREVEEGDSFIGGLRSRECMNGGD